MQDELEDNQKDYFSITHEEWCDLLSTMEVNDNIKKAVAQINRLETSKAVPVNYDSNEYVGVPCKNR